MEIPSIEKLNSLIEDFISQLRQMAGQTRRAFETRPCMPWTTSGSDDNMANSYSFAPL